MEATQKHPKGLYLLFATEMWERFSYYGMRALFVLYMIQALMFDKELASLFYGNYTGLVYLTPLLGGYVADRYWGNRRSILAGGIAMAVGQFLLFLSACYYTSSILAQTLLITGLVVLIFGNGFFKPNISTMVGTLYHPDDKRKDSAYTIFYMGINIGGMLAPLWCGFIGNTGNPEDFKWGFLSACIGMIISTVIFQIFKNKHLNDPSGAPIGMPPVREKAVKSVEEKKQSSSIFNTRAIIAIISTIVLFLLFAINYESFNNSSIGLFYQADWIGALIYSATIVMPVFMITDSSLTTIEKKRILVIYIIAFFIIFFWSAFEQAGASLTFFADEQTDRHILGWEMPASYFQSFNALFIILLAPLFTMLWGALGRRNAEPSSPAKQAMGLLLLSLGYLVIALGVSGVEGDTKVSMLWLVSLYFIHTMGELCLSPIGLSMVNKLSPARFASLIMGVWYLSTAVANKFSGVLSGYYPEGGVAKSFVGYEIANLSDFFMLFVIMSGAAAILLFCLTSYLNKLIKGE
ncbi:MAG: peptide MFS transporter [Bacteroidales bacterium]